MKMPLEILTRLLKGEHFNVEKRKELGLWPSETLNYTYVLKHLSKIIEQCDWFPFEIELNGSNETVYEGIIIHHESDDSYRCYAKRALANAPNIKAEESEYVFKTAKEAAEYYLKWALNLPGRLDGWPVVK